MKREDRRAAFARRSFLTVFVYGNSSTDLAPEL